MRSVRAVFMAVVLFALVVVFFLSTNISTRSTVRSFTDVRKFRLPNTSEYKQNNAIDIVGQNKDTYSASKGVNYITTLDRGRTGNLLFRLFSLVGIATDRGLTPLLQPSMAMKLSRLLNVSMLGTIEDGIDYHWTTFRERSPSIFDQRVQSLDPAYNWTLTGFHQSWKYFQHYEGTIRDKFRFREHLIDKVDLFLDTLSEYPRNCTLNIGIHVRRGDLINARRLEMGYVDIPSSFYEKAIAYYRKKYADKDLHFIVTSNRLMWCEENINGSNIHYSPMKEVEEDIVLLSRCDHIIISEGSFSRIVGWFVSGDVIYLSGVPRPGTKLFNSTVLADIYPDAWIGLQ